MEWELGRGQRSRDDEIEAIVAFVSRHRHSYASLAVCRRALDSGIETIDDGVIADLRDHLGGADDDEVGAYYSIVT